jgi:hypothetical protein
MDATRCVRRGRGEGGGASGLGRLSAWAKKWGIGPPSDFPFFLKFLSFPNHFKSKFFGTFPTSFKVWFENKSCPILKVLQLCLKELKSTLNRF